MMQDFITVIFDANGGGITVSNKRLIVGQPYGELPAPSRFGYEFDGWFTAEEGGELIDENTVVSAASSHALFAHWTRNVVSDKKLEAYRKRKADAKRKKAMIVISAVLVLALIAGLIVVAYLVNRTNLEDVDGTIYKIIKKGGEYILCDGDENRLPMTEDGKYYITAAGSQIKLDAATGAASIYAYVDTVGNEVIGNLVSAKVLAFPQVARAQMSRLEIHNEHGGYAFIGTHKDTDGDGVKEDNYYIEGFKDTVYNQEQFASLIVSCGYVFAMEKITSPIKDADGEYTEYGLAAELRYDASGNAYEYTPSWYKLTDVKGKDYVVIIGDAIVSGAGYYIQYINTDYPDDTFIYIVNSDIAKTVLQPVEALVEPMIVYPTTLSNYYNVRNFAISNNTSDFAVSFSFVPLENRMGTQAATVPYKFLNDEFKYFKASSANIDAALQSFAVMTPYRVVKLGPDDEAMFTYGVADAECVIYYDFLATENNVTETINTLLFISSVTENGTYYVYSALFDMIVEIDMRFMPYVEWDALYWLDTSAYSFNIACTPEIKLSSGGRDIVFSLDNSDTKQFAMTKLTKSSYTRTDREGNKTSYYLVENGGKYHISAETAAGAGPAVVAEGVRYLLTADGDLYLIDDPATTKLDMSSGTTGTGTLYVTDYDVNFDAVLYIFVDTNTGVWGKVKRTVASDAVRVTAQVDGDPSTMLNTTYFRHFFQTILYASVDGSCTLTEEEMAALRAKPDGEAQLVMRISAEDGDYVFRFYQYSERRSYMTINGDGQFYILSDRVVKIFTDALKVIAGEDVSATDKN